MTSQKPQSFQLGEDTLTSARLVQLAQSPGPQLSVSAAAWQRLEGFRKSVDDVLNSQRTVYGINTGFGFLSDVAIKLED